MYSLIEFTGAIRLLVPDGKTFPHGTGPLMMYDGVNDTYYGICNDTWGWIETQIACQEMGYTYGQYLINTANVIGDYGYDVRYYNFDCNGDEKYLSECNYNYSISECQWNQQVYISCNWNHYEDKVIMPLYEKYNETDIFLMAMWKNDTQKWNTFCGIQNYTVEWDSYVDYICDNNFNFGMSIITRGLIQG